MKAIINASTYDYHDFYQNRFIIFDQEIVETGPMSSFKDKGYEIIDVNHDLVLPGFVCGHTHLYSAFARGMSIPFQPKSFKEVLKQYWWKLDHFLELDMVYHSAFSFGLDQLKKGSTTLIDHHAGYHMKGSLNQIKKALVDDLGLRSILAFETSDRYDVDAGIEENKTFIENHKTDKVSGLFGLHASFTLSDATLEKVKENLHDAGIHIHVAESIKDEEDALKKYNKTVIERLRDFDLINDQSILVHCTNASEKELKIVKEKNAIIAINTTSNMNNAVGLPNIQLMEALGIRMMVGNDGLIQSMPMEYLNAYYTSHLQSKNPVGFSVDGIKKMITNSYEYVNSQLNCHIGRIKRNYNADLLVVPYKPFTPLTNDNIFGHIFFGVFPGCLPKHVFINGKHLIDNYIAPTALEEISKASIKQAQTLWKTIKKEGNNLEFNDEVDGLVFDNPLMPAAGPLNGDLEKLLFLQEAGCGGIVTKTISVAEAKIPKPCIYGDKLFIMNSELWSEHSYKLWIDEFLPKFHQQKDRPLIISLGYSKEDMEFLVPKVDKFADAYEISTHYVGTNLDTIKATVRAIRKNTTKPIYMKISPHIPNPEGFAKAIKEAGANGVVAINSLGPTMKIDIDAREIIYSNDSGFVWTSGPAIKPIALATVYKIKQAEPDLTVIGVGGIEKADDIIEFLLAGASGVQMLSAALLKGKDLYKKIIADLPKALEKHGFNSVEEVINTSLKKHTVYRRSLPVLDVDKCIECKLCEKICPYFAIEFKDKITFNEDKCFQCGLCISKCPTKAISFK